MGVAIQSPVHVDREAGLVWSCDGSGAETLPATVWEDLCFGGGWLAVPGFGGDVVDVDRVEANLRKGNIYVSETSPSSG